MDKKNKNKLKGWLFLGLWFVLILLGIIEKRLFGNPDRMMFYHLPAAVFLVLATYQLSAKVRRRYKQSLLEMNRI